MAVQLDPGPMLDQNPVLWMQGGLRLILGREGGVVRVLAPVRDATGSDHGHLLGGHAVAGLGRQDDASTEGFRGTNRLNDHGAIAGLEGGHVLQSRGVGAMSQAQRARWRQHIRWGGAILMWLSLTAAVGDLPQWASEAAFAIGAGLVVWGSIKSRVDRLESDMRDRVTLAEFRGVHDRLARIESSLDRLLERP